VDAVVGHDFGSGVAAWCALVRPDVFRSVALMSAPQRSQEQFWALGWRGHAAASVAGC